MGTDRRSAPGPGRLDAQDARGGRAADLGLDFMTRNLAGILCFLVLSCARAASPTVVIRDVTIVDVADGSLHPDRTVLVSGSRIAAVGSVDEIAVPDDADI